MERKYIIIAPHPDDEIIGCFTYLRKQLVSIVAFPTEFDVKEAHKASTLFSFVPILIEDLLSAIRIGTYKDCHLLFPDPTYDIHPLHRHYGHIGEELLRKGYSVTFYSTNMNAPYIRALEEETKGWKQKYLNSCYPQKRTLWEYDYKYFLFEGQCKWMI